MNKSIVTHKSPKSPISEAFRNMRTNITFSDIDSTLKVLTITSTEKGEGKTTILTNYGVALAQSGKRVLMIDCDLRRPKLHTEFDLSNRIGLTNLLLKEIETIDGIQETEVKNLFIIASGPIPPNPSEILASHRMGDLINNLSNAFDYILLDAPPVGMVTDAAVLTSVTDGYIVVVALGSSNKEGVRLVLETLSNIKANIVGVVVNRMQITKRNGYYAYYEEDELKKNKKGKFVKKG
ncbi:MAG: CpsD/CapB family tyrosine-protein kinase [Eubacteriaceae bacterium]